MKVILSAFLVLCGIFIFIPMAKAHVLESDGNIGAVLHISPDDNPVSERKSSLIFYFNDSISKFSLFTCKCSLIIKEKGKIITKQSLQNTSQLESSNNFIFPAPGVYTLNVRGIPLQSGQNNFQSFTLTYLVRVSSGNLSLQPYPTLLWVGMGLTICLLILGGYAQEYSYNKEKIENDKRRTK